MRDANSTFKEEKNKEVNKPITLYTLFDYDGAGANQYFAEHNEDVVFDGITYAAFPITYDSIPESSDGQINVVEISVSNVNRFIQALLEIYDLKEKKVSIKLVWANQLADAGAYIEDIYYIDSYTSDENVAVFICAPKFDILGIKLPRRIYNRNNCSHTFKDAGCKYTGAETACNKTKQQCKSYNNFTEFGAEPSVPTRRVYNG